MKIVKQILSLTLVCRIGVLAYLSNTHVGHQHSLVSFATTICSLDCEKEDHRFAGNHCAWFQTKRFIEHVRTLSVTSQIYFESETFQCSDQILRLTASYDSCHWNRGPPFV
mgnify:CR=1 FL=1